MNELILLFCCSDQTGCIDFLILRQHSNFNFNSSVHQFFKICSILICDVHGFEICRVFEAAFVPPRFNDLTQEHPSISFLASAMDSTTISRRYLSVTPLLIALMESSRLLMTSLQPAGLASFNEVFRRSSLMTASFAIKMQLALRSVVQEKRSGHEADDDQRVLM